MISQTAPKFTALNKAMTFLFFTEVIKCDLKLLEPPKCGIFEMPVKEYTQLYASEGIHTTVSWRTFVLFPSPLSNYYAFT